MLGSYSWYLLKKPKFSSELYIPISSRLPMSITKVLHIVGWDAYLPSSYLIGKSACFFTWIKCFQQISTMKLPRNLSLGNGSIFHHRFLFLAAKKPMWIIQVNHQCLGSRCYLWPIQRLHWPNPNPEVDSRLPKKKHWGNVGGKPGIQPLGALGAEHDSTWVEASLVYRIFSTKR